MYLLFPKILKLADSDMIMSRSDAAVSFFNSMHYSGRIVRPEAQGQRDTELSLSLSSPLPFPGLQLWEDLD